MKWLSEKENLERLITQGLTYDEIGRMYNVSGAAIRKVAPRIGIQLPQRRKINPNETFNRKEPEIGICQYCGNSFIKYSKAERKYCSVKCSVKHKTQKYINAWSIGEISGTIGYTCSDIVRNYMLQKNNYKCEKCGWGEINPFTGKTPLQIHHIDGNSENNREDNLQVLCPNCHSLTENFGSRNKNAPRGKSAYYGKARPNSSTA